MEADEDQAAARGTGVLDGGSFENTLISGLLQTSDYARAVMQAKPSGLTVEQVDALVTARMERQQVLNKSNPCPARAVAVRAQLFMPHAWPHRRASRVGTPQVRVRATYRRAPARHNNV
ncbi:Scr1 family TA system antitoxin-like transcriptional regulator [Kitasatospora sp. NPDC101155]|uniref:Scr1 family TA system antitoxin-like transcriptional regulator n=1 Tax=Kitasatospora sp. NPDC101155 TaxID=3364097 RepID=UPI0038059C6A